MAVTLTPLAKADPEAVETLLDAAFGADRRGRTAYRLREGAVAIPELSFAAWEDERLVGTLQSWPVALGTASGTESLVMVGPVAVEPDVQSTGIGKALMAALIEAADRTGASALMMIGDPEYYERFGFTAEPAAGWRIDGPYEQRRLLARVRGQVASEGQLLPRHSGERRNPPVFEAAE
ncbi:putative acetyltransferase [Sphingomonas changbaiensis NBRC 104936]|uniref:Putative acetyltransferase n=1 Tax=Sphingomonas changbaiensis NBRC 104936 TaxID=1219043 RepID=A0A0E9MT19_9SPHN|nr:N-acetyltransferase [Sphingomonas changbaiensis]GAO40724.1 putative acetyltransferase [Sphingomonas changbaiensis NBRC 104936]